MFASRTFRLDRIETTPESVGEPGAFERPPAESATPPLPWQLRVDEEVTAILAVDAGQAAWAVTAAGPSATVERQADGSVVLGITVTNRDAFRAFVLEFLDHSGWLQHYTLRKFLRQGVGLRCDNLFVSVLTTCDIGHPSLPLKRGVSCP